MSSRVVSSNRQISENNTAFDLLRSTSSAHISNKTFRFVSYIVGLVVPVTELKQVKIFA